MIGEPRHSADVCGYVLAATSQDEADEAHSRHLEKMHLHHDAFRLVFQCISGWCLMQWRNQDDFETGIHGAHRAPRAMAFIDLRRAFDLHLEVGDPDMELANHRITVMLRGGNYYFCVEIPDDVQVWFEAIRGVIQDAHWQAICLRDTQIHQNKRWPAAIGIADALFMRGGPVGERAMAILFHAYDIDYDGVLRAGELMVLIRELQAAIVYCEGSAEGRERDTAVMQAVSRMPEDELFGRAIYLRKYLCLHNDGMVRKDDFIRLGARYLGEAVGAGGLMADLGGPVPESAFDWPSAGDFLPF